MAAMSTTVPSIDPMRTLRHELRNDLQTISFCTEVLASERASPAQKTDSVAAIKRAISHIGKVLEEGE